MVTGVPEAAQAVQPGHRGKHRFTVIAFVIVGAITVVLSRVGYLAYFNSAPDGDTVGHLRIGIAALLPAWTPMVAMLVLVPIAIVRTARDRATWWLPLVALGLTAAGVAAAAVLLATG